MSTDKTALGDLKILISIVVIASLIWGFFKVTSKTMATARGAKTTQVNQK
jgi:hypothetical protein